MGSSMLHDCRINSFTDHITPTNPYQLCKHIEYQKCLEFHGMTKLFHISYRIWIFLLWNTEAHSDYNGFDDFASAPPFLSGSWYFLLGFQPLQTHTSKDKKPLLVISIINWICKSSGHNVIMNFVEAKYTYRLLDWTRKFKLVKQEGMYCLLYTSPSPRD